MISEKTTVKIEYLGHFMDLTGQSCDTIETSTNLRQAYHEVLSYLHRQYGIEPPMIMLLGDKHITGAIKQRGDEPLHPQDVFKVIPFMSGG